MRTGSGTDHSHAPNSKDMRYFTLCSALALAAGIQAQMARPELPHLHHLAPEPPQHGQPLRLPAKPPKLATKASVIELGRMQNAYSMQRNGVHQVDHVPALNTVTFVRRQNPADHGNTGGSSLRFDHSVDGGATWQLGTLLSPTYFAGGIAGNGARHPNGFLYNPPGNTDPANAWVVAQAPSVSATNNFSILMSASARLNGSDAHDAYTNLWPGQSTAWVQGMHYASNGHAWSMVTNVDTADQSVSRGEFKVLKGTWNSTDQRMDWAVNATLTDEFHSYESGGQNFILNIDWSIAFGPDGNVGYAVVVGKLLNGPPSNTYPIVWKTTDAGNTWVQTPVHDMSQEGVMIDNLLPAQGSGLVRPYFRQTSVLVDANDHLHLMAEVLSGYHSSPDSANWIYVDASTRTLVHARMSADDTWTVTKVADVVNTDGFLFGESAIAQDIRPQLARTADGTKVFMTWSATSDEETNILPDIHARAYDVLTGQFAAEKVLTEGTGAELGAYWFQLAPTVITGGSGPQYELAIVYCQPGNTDLLPSTAFYLRGVGFNEAEINVGINALEPGVHFEVFPNPGNGIFNVRMDDMGTVDIVVADASGRSVYSTRVNATQHVIDLSGKPAGLYLLTATGTNGRVTKKLIME